MVLDMHAFMGGFFFPYGYKSNTNVSSIHKETLKVYMSMAYVNMSTRVAMSCQSKMSLSLVLSNDITVIKVSRQKYNQYWIADSQYFLVIKIYKIICSLFNPFHLDWKTVFFSFFTNFQVYFSLLRPKHDCYVKITSSKRQSRQHF